ncbi:MAG TPA: hypothetical protein VFE37_16955 [Chloroflexota bacterium]|nr:hypothetical protein [Chloroflexota bacterium]
MDLENALVSWMDENEVEMFQILKEEEGRFRALHPGLEAADVRLNAMAMANRRFIARALGEVLPAYLDSWQSGSRE